jgi:ATP-binding cassette, subfamily C (CFTR/MRP), member 1
VATFAVFAIQAHINGSQSLDTVRTFTSLALIHLVSYPVSRLLSAAPAVASSLGCFERIQNFLIRSENNSDDANITRHTRLAESNGELPNGIRDSEPILRHDGSDDSSDIATRVGEMAIVVQNIDIALHSGKLIIRDLSLSIDKGSVLCITGPIGSGKSVLLKYLMGHIKVTHDCIKMADSIGDIGYCAQIPWIPQGTVKEIIRGPSILDDESFDVAWYRNVLNICALNPDLETFTYGDATTVGSRGRKLSGGQRQRLALARALYSRPNIFFFDSVFSALDNSTKQAILERLFGSHGLFKTMGATVIMVTYDSTSVMISTKQSYMLTQS